MPRNLADAESADLDFDSCDPEDPGLAPSFADLPRLPGLCGPDLWDGTIAPERRFLIPDWIVRGSAGLLTGEDGVGKSLLAQLMATAAAAGVPFLGLPIERCRAFYITCEDESEELQRRQQAINRGLGITMADLRGWLLCDTLKGVLGNQLATFSGEGGPQPTQRFHQIRREAREFGARLIFLDNAAHVFAGNENARHEVASFLGLLENFSIEIDGSVVLIAHPNKAYSQGRGQGNEYSGSTGWSAHVRNRLFLEREGDDMANPDGRVLRRSKANYAARGAEISFVWHQGTFALLDDLPPDTARALVEVSRANAENDAFLRCLSKATDQRENVSHSPSAGNYAPKVFANMAIGKGFDRAAFERAMRRLIDLGTIRPNEKVFQYESNRTWAKGIILAPESAQRLAQSLHKAPHEGCTEGNSEPAEILHKACTELHTTGGLYTTYTGAALEAAAPLHESEGNDD